MKIDFKNVVILFLGLSLIVVTVAFFWKRNNDRESIEKNILSAKTKLFSIISNPQAWENTIEKNVVLHCANKKSGIACPLQVNIPFVLYDANGIIVFDPKVNGINFDGNICLRDQGQCRVNLALNYIEVCNNPQTPCSTPDQHMVLVDFSPVTLETGEALNLNRAPYSFSIQKKTDPSYLNGLPNFNRMVYTTPPIGVPDVQTKAPYQEGSASYQRI